MSLLRSRRIPAAAWAPVLLAGLALAVPADSASPQSAFKLPWLITGDFIYIEHTDWQGGDTKIKDESVIRLEEVELALARQVSNQLAVYTLDHCEFTAQGEESITTRSATSVSVNTRKKTGGAELTFPTQTDMSAPDPRNPSQFIWRLYDNKFYFNFQAPIDRGQVTQTSSSSDGSEPTPPVTSDYMWTCGISGSVDYNAKTRTYRFVILHEYQVPYREDSEIKSRVVASGELTGQVLK